MRGRVALAVVVGTAAWIGGALAVAGAGLAQGQPASPTYAKDVAPILFRNCTSCHRPGEIGPMSLLTYADVRPYATSIKEQVEAGHMPPWHADAPAGTFRNDRRLTDVEKSTLLRWVEAGAPRGDDQDMPAPPTYTDGWTIGEPDVEFSLPEAYAVPASGTIDYQYFEVPTSFTEDKWIQAIEIRPDARDVVHHVLVYAREPEGLPARPRILVQPRPPAAETRAERPATPPAPRPGEAPPRRLGALIATMAPGWNAMVFEPGTALQIRAGAVLTFQMHYTANGTPRTDRSKVGFVFAKDPPAREMRAGSFINTRMRIPAGAEHHRVDAEVTFAQDAEVWGLFPHTHLRGVKWEYTLVHPDGRTEMILDVPRYDFNWQTYYMFTRPLAVARGSKIISSAWYDNSAKNPFNPDASVEVRWGDQTWEEMQYTGVTYTTAPPAAPAGRDRR